MIFGEVLADPLYLVVNCAETRLQVVLGGLHGCAWSESFHAPGRAMPLLAPSIARGFKHLGIDAGGLRGVAYVCGPGSFTGLRMSIAHVLGLSQAANIPVAGLEYLPLLAAAPGLLVNGRLWCIVHSRHKQVYAQKFDCPQKMPADGPRVFCVGNAPGAFALRRLPGTWFGSIPESGNDTRRFPDRYTAGCFQ